MKRLGILLLFVAFIVAVPLSAWAAEAEIEYGVNFDGQIFTNQWNLLHVTVQNTGDQDIQGVVEVRHRGRMQQEVFIEQGKEVTLEFYLPPQEMANYFFSDWASRATVAILDGRGREINSVDVVVDRQVYEPIHYAGIVTDSLAPWQRLTTVEPALSPVAMDPVHFNNSMFMRNFSFIVLSDPGTLNLRPEQIQNLSDWVGGGGTLIISGGSNWQRNQALVDSDLLPFVGTGVTTTEELQPESPFFQFPATVTGPIPVVTGSVAGDVLLTTGQQPLLLTKSFGNGRVFYSTLNLEAAPFDNALNFEEYWRYLLANAGANEAGSRLVVDHWLLSSLFGRLYGSEMSLGGLTPSRVFLGLFIYVVLLGPVNFLVLRRLKRLDWAWVTIPLAAIIFTTGTFMVGSGGRSTERITYQIGIVELLQQERMHVETLGGLYIPSRGTINTESQWRYLVPASGTTVRGQDVQIINPPLWSVQRLYGGDVIDFPGTIQFDVRVDDGHAEVTIVNTLDREMFDGYLQVGNSLYKVGPLAKGETKTVPLAQTVHDIDLTALFSHYDIDPMHGMPPGFRSNSAGISYFGFTDQAVQPLYEIGERSQVLDIIVSGTDFSNVEFTGDTVDIPKGWLTPSIQARREQYARANESMYIIEGNEYGEFRFTLPENLDPARGVFHLTFEEFWGQGTGKLLIWSQANQEWEELDSIQVGRQGQSLSLPDPSSYLVENNLMFRLEMDSGQFAFSGNSLYITVQNGGIR
ncbi:MAG: hypothetical protein FH749_07265 [Firmicutes bacterium]|nr:hypothetical protein [Bacillota bacterium]